MTSGSARIRWDGDGLPFSPRFDDHYFSRRDGRGETRHVFLQGNGLPGRWMGRESFVIGELGFGVGLNFLETWDCWRRIRSPGQHLLFQSVEAYPLARDEAERALSGWPQLSGLAERLFSNSGIGEACIDAGRTVIRADGQTTLELHVGFAERVMPAFVCTDAWFLDGFSPANNPDMWSKSLMKLVADRTVPGGTFASYTAAGWVRRNLQEAGFIVEKRLGFGLKRHMIAGVRP